MGIWVSKLMSLFGEREARILVLGLDNAGKTTILCTSRPPARPGSDRPADPAPHPPGTRGPAG